MEQDEDDDHSSITTTFYYTSKDYVIINVLPDDYSLGSIEYAFLPAIVYSAQRGGHYYLSFVYGKTGGTFRWGDHMTLIPDTAKEYVTNYINSGAVNLYSDVDDVVYTWGKGTYYQRSGVVGTTWLSDIQYYRFTYPYINFSGGDTYAQYTFNFKTGQTSTGAVVTYVNTTQYNGKTLNTMLDEDSQTVLIKCDSDVIAQFQYPELMQSIAFDTYTITENADPVDLTVTGTKKPATAYTYTLKFNFYWGSTLKTTVTKVVQSTDGYAGARIISRVVGRTLSYYTDEKEQLVASYTYDDDIVEHAPTTLFLPNFKFNFNGSFDVMAVGSSVPPTPSTGDLEMTLYKNTAESNRVDKTSYLTKVTDVYGTLREETSITSPSFNIEYSKVPDFNYIYIPKFSRYYFVTGITSVDNNLWRISCSVDVLMSYKSYILNLNAHVDRNEQFCDPMIPDTERVVSGGQEVYESAFILPEDRPQIVMSPTAATDRNAYCMVVNGYRLTVKELS